MMSSLPPRPLTSQRGMDCGTKRSSRHRTRALFYSIPSPILKTCRIGWRGGLSLEIRKQANPIRAMTEIWAEPNCVRVRWFTCCLTTTLPQEGCILPNPRSMSTELEDKTWVGISCFSQQQQKNKPLTASPMVCFGLLYVWYHQVVLWDFSESHQNQAQTRSDPERAQSQSHSMTFHSFCDEARIWESKCPVSPFHFISQTSWCKKWRLSEWSFTNAHFLLDDGCRRFLKATGEVMRRGWTLFSSNFPA